MDWLLFTILILILLIFVVAANSSYLEKLVKGASEGAAQDYLHDYLQTGRVDEDELEQAYEDIPLDYKNIKITKQVLASAKRLDAVLRKIVTHALLHLHISKNNLNNLSLSALKKDKTMLSAIAKSRKLDEIDTAEVKELIGLIETQLTEYKGASINKVSTDEDEMALKVLLQKGTSSGYKSDTESLRLLRKCREDNEILRQKIRDWQLLGPSSGALVDQLVREKAALEARIRDLQARGDCSAYIAQINKLQRDLSECEKNVAAIAAALP
jgi:hypothetical protein